MAESNTFSMILAALGDPMCLLLTLVGTIMGVVFGCLPGLSATMGVALLVPLTFGFSPLYALSMMLAVYVGSMSGGAISSILINIPGTPSAVVTTLDGYPMAMQGKAAEAIGWSNMSSFFGGFISWAILVFVAPPVARIALKFGPAEYAALALFGLTIIASVSGKSLIKGLISGLLGLWLSVIGVDPIVGNFRFTFNSMNLMNGISTIAALVGFYALPQILESITEPEREASIKIKDNKWLYIPNFVELWKHKFNLIYSSIIGTIVGIIPATGGNIASFLAYDHIKRFSKHPEKFGKGAVEGVIASEAANNGVTGGALIPLLTLGIPGDSVTAVLLGGLMIHGLQPGPQLFSKQPNLIVGIFTTILIANILTAVVMFMGNKTFIKILKVPTYFLAPMLIILSVVGSYALRGSFFDVGVTILLGLFAYLMSLGGFPMAPTVLGLVLGPLFEGEMRRALILSDGSWSIFFVRPISLVLIVLSLLVCLNEVKRAFTKGDTEAITI